MYGEGCDAHPLLKQLPHVTWQESRPGFHRGSRRRAHGPRPPDCPRAWGPGDQPPPEHEDLCILSECQPDYCCCSVARLHLGEVYPLGWLLMGRHTCITRIASSIHNLNFPAGISGGGGSRCHRSEMMSIRQRAGISTTQHFLTNFYFAGQTLGYLVVVLNDAAGTGAAGRGSSRSCSRAGLTVTTGRSLLLLMVGSVRRCSCCCCHCFLVHIYRGTRTGGRLRQATPAVGLVAAPIRVDRNARGQ